MSFKTFWKKKFSKKPWLDVQHSIMPDGQVKLELDWNKPFINDLVKLGYYGHNEEEIVQQYLTSLTNRELDPFLDDNEDLPISNEHPMLNDENKVYR